MLSHPLQNNPFSTTFEDHLIKNNVSKEHIQLLQQYPDLLNSEIWGQKRSHITQLFGERPEIYKNMDGHNGIDFRAKVGTSIFAPIEGEIIVRNSKTGYGKHVRIRSHHSNLEVVLGHFSEITIHREKVNRHDLLGYSGNTGFSTGPHLHLGVRRLLPHPTNPIFKWFIKDYDNGYYGYFDPLRLLITWKGTQNDNTYFGN